MYRRRAGIRAQDEEDLVQTLYARLLKRFARLDQKREHALGLVSKVLNQILANLARDRRAIKRADGHVGTLHTTVNVAGQNVELVDTITLLHLNARTGAGSLTHEELASLRADVAAAIKDLPADQHDLAQHLKRDSLSEVARKTGIPRATLQYRLQQLLEVFDHRDLRDYL
jgi:RNA polymerase sigma factor (sigma-70 family)